jgi:hypothetical protein
MYAAHARTHVSPKGDAVAVEVVLLSDNIISYIDMCRREGTSLQQGMNFGIGGTHSVILMSVRRNAPYRDQLEDDGTTLVYEGHDQPRGQTIRIQRLQINQNDSHQAV